MLLSLSDMVISFITSLCLYLMIEAPFRKIFRELLMPPRPHHPTKETIDQSNGTDHHMINNNNNTNRQDSRL